MEHVFRRTASELFMGYFIIVGGEGFVISAEHGLFLCE